ncbi:MAG: beta-lactamase family protein [Kiritimatiellae bacterium]|nr:beta-lactamase family protein [Kiritimatiellia bacterium]
MDTEPTGREDSTAAESGIYFPPPGDGLANQAQRAAAEVGLDPDLPARLGAYVQAHPIPNPTKGIRWALWRHGYLVHVDGAFNRTCDVASLRKTWHALAVGAAIGQGRIPSLDQKLSVWQTELKGNKAAATWRHVITQSAGFDYPHPDFPAIGDPRPGTVWTYSDWNLVHVCHALAKVYGKKDFHDEYADVLKQAYFDAIGMTHWSTDIVFDRSSGMKDGVRLVISLEHMGRLGLLVLARGRWQGRQLIPRWFVEALETKQTYGMAVNYNGPYDGNMHFLRQSGRFAEAPYGFLTWVNTDGDYFPDADRAWAWGRGAGGTIVLWNRNNGIVFAAVGLQILSGPDCFPRVIEQGVAGPNPLFGARKTDWEIVNRSRRPFSRVRRRPGEGGSTDPVSPDHHCGGGTG